MRPFFALLQHYWPRKLKFGKNAKKKHLEILHMCTINCVPLIKIIWCMVPEIWSSTELMFLSYWEIFYLFTPPPPKIKIWKKWKKHLDVSSFNTSVPKIMIICYIAPEIWHVADVIVIFYFGLFLPLYCLTDWKIKISKKWREKNTWRYHFTQVYQKSSYAILFLRYGAWQI